MKEWLETPLFFQYVDKLKSEFVSKSTQFTVVVSSQNVIGGFNIE